MSDSTEADSGVRQGGPSVMVAAPGDVEALAEEALLAMLSGDHGSPIVLRARRGHSPSARALANASDLVATLALATDGQEPSDALRARILASARGRSPDVEGERGSREVPAPAAPPLAPCEMIARIHETLPDEVARLERIERLGVAGVVGGVTSAVDDDAEIASLLARMAPFTEPGALFVSVVRGGQTIHRVHRGFPTEFGNVDIVPRQTSFCTHCVSGDAPLVVHDAAAEAYFRSAVVVQTFSARTYIGVPLRVDGVGVGALCTIGFFRPRRVSQAELELFLLFAPHAEAVIARDQGARERIHPGGLYTEDLFSRLLDAQLRRETSELPPPALLVVPSSHRGLVSETDLAASLSGGAIGVLVAGDDAAGVVARLGAKRAVPLSRDILDAPAWLALARASAPSR